MGYAHFAEDSDVHVIQDTKGGFTCLCSPPSLPPFSCATAREMIDHLLVHRVQGDRVPEAALEALRWDAKPDVVVEEEVEGLFTCVGCARGAEFVLIAAREMLDHVVEHRARGALVLEETLDVLRAALFRA